MKRYLPHFIFGALIAPLLVSGCGGTRKAQADDPANAPPAAVVKVERSDLASTLEIASEFEPYQEIEVYAKVSGYIQNLAVDWGTHVRQGQILATLEIPELQQQLQQDEAAIRRSQSDLDRAREEVSRAQSAYQVAHLTYTRLADVQKSRPELVAQQEVDVAQGKDQEADANLSASKAALGAAQESLSVSKAAHEKDKAMYAYSRITAPFDGVVTEISAYKGALLPAGTSSNKGDLALCRLSQNNLLRLVIPLPERAVPDVHDGETLNVHVSAINRTFSGQISHLSGQIDTATRTMHTEVSVPNAKYELVPGMYASVQIPLHKVQGVLTLPVQAVQTSSESRGVVLVVNSTNHVESRDVTIGIQSASRIEVLSGVQEGDRVIFGEQSAFRPGELVKPVSAELPVPKQE